MGNKLCVASDESQNFDQQDDEIKKPAKQKTLLTTEQQKSISIRRVKSQHNLSTRHYGVAKINDEDNNTQDFSNISGLLNLENISQNKKFNLLAQFASKQDYEKEKTEQAQQKPKITKRRQPNQAHKAVKPTIIKKEEKKLFEISSPYCFQQSISKTKPEQDSNDIIQLENFYNEPDESQKQMDKLKRLIQMRKNIKNKQSITPEEDANKRHLLVKIEQLLKDLITENRKLKENDGQFKIHDEQDQSENQKVWRNQLTIRNYYSSVCKSWKDEESENEQDIESPRFQEEDHHQFINQIVHEIISNSFNRHNQKEQKFMPSIPKLNLTKAESQEFQKIASYQIPSNKKISKRDLLILSGDLELHIGKKIQAEPRSTRSNKIEQLGEFLETIYEAKPRSGPNAEEASNQVSDSQKMEDIQNVYRQAWLKNLADYRRKNSNFYSEGPGSERLCVKLDITDQKKRRTDKKIKQVESSKKSQVSNEFMQFRQLLLFQNQQDSTVNLKSVKTCDIRRMLQMESENEEIQNLEDSSLSEDEHTPQSLLKIPELIDFQKFLNATVQEMPNEEKPKKYTKNKKNLRLSSGSESRSDSLHKHIKDSDFQNLFSARTSSDKSSKQNFVSVQKNMRTSILRQKIEAKKQQLYTAR